MSISVNSQLIKELRERTGAGILDCKNALIDCNNDIEASIELLRKKGAATANKKSGNIAAEGLIGVSLNNNTLKLLEMNAQTDFVAKNSEFQSILHDVLELMENKDAEIEDLKQMTFSSGVTVNQRIVNAIATIGENITLRRFSIISGNHLYYYIHNSVNSNMGKIISAISFDSDASYEELTTIGKQLAMHIAASKPLSLSVADLDQKTLETEKRIQREISAQSGKPAEVIEKMVEGRIAKYYKEVVLLEQSFVMDSKITVKEFVENTAKSLGKKVQIKEFKLFIVGDGIKKEESNFAAEVASMADNK